MSRLFQNRTLYIKLRKLKFFKILLISSLLIICPCISVYASLYETSRNRSNTTYVPFAETPGNINLSVSRFVRSSRKGYSVSPGSDYDKASKPGSLSLFSDNTNRAVLYIPYSNSGNTVSSRGGNVNQNTGSGNYTLNTTFLSSLLSLFKSSNPMAASEVSLSEALQNEENNPPYDPNIMDDSNIIGGVGAPIGEEVPFLLLLSVVYFIVLISRCRSRKYKLQEDK